MRPYGPSDAPIAIVCDYPSAQEHARGIPLSDYAGNLFSDYLSRKGFIKSSFFIVTVLDKPVPDDDLSVHLSKRKTCPGPGWEGKTGAWVSPELNAGISRVEALLGEVRPRLVLALGEAALVATTGHQGHTKWRGSRLTVPGKPYQVVPLLAPRRLQLDPTQAHIFQIDIARAKAIFNGTQLPRDYKFQVSPTFVEVENRLTWLLERADIAQSVGKTFPLSGDLETRSGHIACFGIAWNPEEAICIPSLTVNDEKPFYWTEEEEAKILLYISRLFAHPAVVWIGQNFLYDCQYFYRHWGILPKNALDTMIGHHSIFSNMRKGLDFLSAMYAQDHVYWKDEIKEWDPEIGEQQYWIYNCLALDTPVLMADSSYKPLADVVVGDKLFTFEENPSGHRYARVGRIATVTKTARALKHVNRYTFSDGTYLDATPDHKILTTRGKDSRSSWQWREFKDLVIGDKVASLGKPWQLDSSFNGGWLSGLFDGEGTVGFLNTNKGYAPYPRIGFSQKPGAILDKAVQLLTDAGYSVRMSPKPSATYVDINGGLVEQLRFLGQFRPIRIGKNFHRYSYCEGLSGFSGLPRPHLVSVESLGEVPVGDITTTEGTFVAGGVFIHNCKDACITWEIMPEIQDSIEKQGVTAHAEFQQQLFFPVLRIMNRGIRLDVSQRKTLRDDLIKAQFDRQEKLDYIAGHPLNPQSPKQLSNFFYHDLGIPGVKNLAGDALTTNSPAMALIANREPILKPLCQLIVELRSIGVFLGTFIDARLDSDGRMRCSFSIAGPTTYRFSSSENAFGSGMNLQNIPVAEKAKIKSKDYIQLPNIRKLFIPDPGYTFFDMDLDRADLQVVVWEAEDSDLKLALRDNLDMHCLNACAIFDIKGIPYDELRESHPNYKDHRGRIGEAFRGKAKAGVHATNYGVGDRKLAQALGITVQEASRFRARWFAAHPGVRKWHLRVEESASKRGFVDNRFGARLYTLGRTNLPELLGWVPQSTVAGVINRALVNIDAEEQFGGTSVQLLLQVHDSLGGQFLSNRQEEEIANLRRLARVEIPYEDPLVIPVGIKTSHVSWGDCK